MTEGAIWSTGDVRKVDSERLRLFAPAASAALGASVASLLGITLSHLEERDFEDGEHKIRPLEPVDGADVFVLHSLYGEPGNSANDKLCRLLFFIGALKDAGAARVTAVVPYLCYARKDRRTKALDPVTIRYVASMFEAVGTDAVVTLDVHNDAAFQNAFRCRAIALTSPVLQIPAILSQTGGEKLSIVSPDLGGGKRAELLRRTLEQVTGRPVGFGFAEKHRSAGVVSGDLFVGDVEETTCIIVDDLISTGGTILRAAQAAKANGAARILACVGHGLFMPGAEKALAPELIEAIIETDTVPPFRLPEGPVRDKLIIAPSAPLFAEVIGRLHEHRPLSDLVVY